LSGEKLIDNIDYRDSLLDREPEALGGEMEGGGLYVAAVEKNVDWCVVKAVCDFADGKKRENKTRNQKEAAHNAAKFVLAAVALGGFRPSASTTGMSSKSLLRGAAGVLALVLIAVAAYLSVDPEQPAAAPTEITANATSSDSGVVSPTTSRESDRGGVEENMEERASTSGNTSGGSSGGDTNGVAQTEGANKTMPSERTGSGGVLSESDGGAGGELEYLVWKRSVDGPAWTYWLDSDSSGPNVLGAAKGVWMQWKGKPARLAQRHATVSVPDCMLFHGGGPDPSEIYSLVESTEGQEVLRDEVEEYLNEKRENYVDAAEEEVTYEVLEVGSQEHSIAVGAANWVKMEGQFGDYLFVSGRGVIDDCGWAPEWSGMWIVDLQIGDTVMLDETLEIDDIGIDKRTELVRQFREDYDFYKQKLEDVSSDRTLDWATPSYEDGRLVLNLEFSIPAPCARCGSGLTVGRTGGSITLHTFPGAFSEIARLPTPVREFLGIVPEGVQFGWSEFERGKIDMSDFAGTTGRRR
jgi:hypothetical protein